MNQQEERLVAIETRIAFNEKIIKELNDVVYQQQRDVERLSSVCGRLADRLKEISGLTWNTDTGSPE